MSFAIPAEVRSGVSRGLQSMRNSYAELLKSSKSESDDDDDQFHDARGQAGDALSGADSALSGTDALEIKSKYFKNVRGLTRQPFFEGHKQPFFSHSTRQTMKKPVTDASKSGTNPVKSAIENVVATHAEVEKKSDSLKGLTPEEAVDKVMARYKQ